MALAGAIFSTIVLKNVSIGPSSLGSGAKEIAAVPTYFTARQDILAVNCLIFGIQLPGSWAPRPGI